MPDDYEIIMQPEAEANLASAHEWVLQNSPERAAEWLNGFMEALQSLTTFPRRCPLAPENAVFETEVRQLVYGKGRQSYRILYTVQEEKIHILFIRHSARPWLFSLPDED